MLIVNKFGEVATYTPKFGGNRDENVTERVRVVLRPMTGAEQRKHSIDAAAQSAAGNAVATVYETVKAHVTHVDNVVVAVWAADGVSVVERDVTDVAEFLELAPNELVIELYQAITNASTLTEGQKKV